MSEVGDALPDALGLAASMRLWHARVSYVLQQADVDHVLIKGSTWCPSLALPEISADVDVLIAPEQFARALGALNAAGFDRVLAGLSDEEAALHSTTLRGPRSPEVDVHRALPGIDRDPVRTWSEIKGGLLCHVELAHHRVPVLDDPAQVVVAAASSARDGPRSSATRRLQAAAEQVDWAEVATVARRLSAEGTLRAGLTTAGLDEIADGLRLGPVPHRFAQHVSRGDLRLEEALASPWRRGIKIAARELWPSDGFLAFTQPQVPVRTARRRHISFVLRELPRALLAVVVRRISPKP